MATPIPANDATFTLAEIAAATGGHVSSGDPVSVVSGVAIDSRVVKPGTLFVAIVGAAHDAHAYLADVVNREAGAVLVRRGTTLPDAFTASIEVEDTQVALGRLARLHRDRFAGPVIAITGSVGKTGTKELVAAALSGAGRVVHATPGNLNNLVGLPMTLFARRADATAMVLELGMSTPGEIAQLVEIARPDVALLTSIAEVHTEGVGGIDGVEREKGALLAAIAPAGIAIANGDDDRCVRALAASPAGTKLTFGRREGCDVRLTSVAIEPDGHTRCEIDVRGKRVKLDLRLLGAPAALSAAAALALVDALGGDLDGARDALAEVEPTPGRLYMLEGADGVVILDDSYNASPIAMTASIATAAQLAARRSAGLVLVLADMRELADADEHHAEIGRVVARSPARAFIAVGEHMVHAARTAMRASRTIEVHRVRDAEDAIEALAGAVEHGDVVLVKGSRSMRMERVVAAYELDYESEERSREGRR